jgi:O-antigen/teichoic acid export membrane protein
LVSDVTPSVLAATEYDAAALRRYLRLVTAGIAFIAFPATFGLAVVADDFVLLVFGERWLGTVGPLRVLAFVAAMRSITPILSQVLIATEQPKRNMQFSLTAALVMPVFFLVGSRWGITGVAVGWLIGHPLVTVPILLRRALGTVEMPFRAYLRTLGPAALASAATVFVVLLARLAIPAEWTLAARLTVEVSAGVATYILVIFPTYRSRLRAFSSLLRSGPGGKGRSEESADVLSG